MILLLFGPLALLALALLAVPFLLVLGPAAYAYRVTYEAGLGNDAALGAGALTLIYAVVIVWRVHSSFGLILGLVLVPAVLGWLVRSTNH